MSRFHTGFLDPDTAASWRAQSGEEKHRRPSWEPGTTLTPITLSPTAVTLHFKENQAFL